MSTLLAPLGGNLLWTQNTETNENDGSTSDDKGNKELPQTAEWEITNRLEMEKKKKKKSENHWVNNTLYLYPLHTPSTPPSLPIFSLF